MKRTISLLAAFALALQLATVGRAQSAGPNGHYYKVALEPNLSWEQARIKAAESTFNGVHGYLATIASLEEDQSIETLRQQAATMGLLWIGASQETNAPSSREGWVWINGEGFLPGEKGGATYANWLPGEPNDAAGPNSEQFLAIGSSNRFGWSSEPGNTPAQGYVIEYPGAGTQAKVWVSARDPIATEQGASNADIATFEFRREGDLSLDLPIFYSIHGTASNGVDYDEIEKSIVIPAAR